MVRHIKTEFRNQLGNDTEEALLAVGVGRISLQNMLLRGESGQRRY